MCGKAEDIDEVILHIYRNMPCRLGGIDAEDYAVAAAKGAYFADREGIAADIRRVDAGQHFRRWTQLFDDLVDDILGRERPTLFVCLENVVAELIVLRKSCGWAENTVVLHIADKHMTAAAHDPLDRHI